MLHRFLNRFGLAHVSQMIKQSQTIIANMWLKRTIQIDIQQKLSVIIQI